MHLFALHCSKCRNETPRFVIVGVSFGGTNLATRLMDHTLSLLLVGFVLVDNLDQAMVDSER